MNSESIPCPHRIIEDMGSAFSMGAVGGTVWHFFAGIKHSPRGERLLGGYQRVVIRAPTLGGNFAVWGGLFSFYDCQLIRVRQKEDPLNAIASGALTGGTLAIRAGKAAILTNAAIGGVLLALIEGLSVLITNMTQPQQPHMIQQQQHLQHSKTDKDNLHNMTIQQRNEYNNMFTTEDFSFTENELEDI